MVYARGEGRILPDMSLDLQNAEGQPLTSVEPLVEGFRRAERAKAPGALKIGLEHEKLLYSRASRAVPYEGPEGVGALLEALARNGHSPFRERDGLPVIALTRGQATISLEPGGQLELSGAPWLTAREAHQENLRHLDEVKTAAKSLNLRLVALGYRPFETLASMPWMPKRRYGVMQKTLGTQGRYALDMMLMTATGQVSLDWTSEADCARKVTLAARVAPLWVALFANSPLAQGQKTGFLSFRSQVWSDVDPARCGYPSFMLDGSFSYRRYVEWALDAPLLFLRRRGEYLSPKLTFRQLLSEGFEGSPATSTDWVDHLSTLFPEVRIKTVMEIRGADCVGPGLTGGLAALLRGLFYDSSAMDEAEKLLPKLSYDAHLAFHDEARRKGLAGQLEGRPLARYAEELVAIARRGLQRLDALDAPLLEPLEAQARSGQSPAQRILEAFDAGGPEAVLSAAEL